MRKSVFWSVALATLFGGSGLAYSWGNTSQAKNSSSSTVVCSKPCNPVLNDQCRVAGPACPEACEPCPECPLCPECP